MEREGIRLITKERSRQIKKEGFDADHDDEHTSHELAWAALCYTAPEPVYFMEQGGDRIDFIDPWPGNWPHFDKRKRDASDNLVPGGLLAQNAPGQRILDLTKAGALIAAEIDRLLRLKK